MLTFEQYPDFRLVTNLKFLSKLIEKFVFVQLNNYLKANALDKPFNLRTNPTTVQRLHCLGSQMTSYWTGRGENVLLFLLLLDLSAEIDTVDHSLLL